MKYYTIESHAEKEAPFGIVGLETAACLTHNELVQVS